MRFFYRNNLPSDLLDLSVIEPALGLDDNTIRRYVKLYKDLDIEDYLKDNYVRYGGCLISEQEGQLIK